MKDFSNKKSYLCLYENLSYHDKLKEFNSNRQYIEDILFTYKKF